jgi:hypothetical protein
MVRPDGRYAATSFVDGDGLVPGRYVVHVECWQQLPTQGRGGQSHVPDDFQGRKELIVGEREQSITFDIDVPSAK